MPAGTEVLLSSRNCTSWAFFLVFYVPKEFNERMVDVIRIRPYSTSSNISTQSDWSWHFNFWNKLNIRRFTDSLVIQFSLVLSGAFKSAHFSLEHLAYACACITEIYRTPFFFFMLVSVVLSCGLRREFFPGFVSVVIELCLVANLTLNPGWQPCLQRRSYLCLKLIRTGREEGEVDKHEILFIKREIII